MQNDAAVRFRAEEEPQFAEQCASLGIAASEAGGLSLEEKIYVVWETQGDWITNVPDMRAIGMYLMSYITSIFETKILDYLSEAKDFLQSEESLEAFFKGKNLSDGDRARLARWQSWSKSPEQEAIVDCFRRATEGVGE